MKKLSTVTRLVFITSIVGLCLTLISLFTVFIGYPGWTIGIALGSIIDVAIVALLYVGGDRTLKNNKPAITYLFYFLRIILLAIGLIVPALLDYKFHIGFMKYSTFGAAIGYIPGIFVVILVLTKGDNDLIEGKDK